MAIEGPLKELSLEDVLQLLDLARKTGVLRLNSELLNDDAEIHFDRGKILYARRRRSTRSLGQQLLRAGQLTERELEQALERQKETPDQRLGEILLEMGSVDQDDLRMQLRFQLEETIYELMSWTEGSFRFEEEANVLDGVVEIRIPAASLLMEGARRIDEWTQLESKVPTPDSVPVLAPTDDGDGARLDLRPDEWEVLAEIDGERDLREMAATLGRSQFDVAKIVYGLVNTGVIDVQERPSKLPERELDEAIEAIERSLADGGAEEATQRASELQRLHPDRADVALLYGRALAAQERMRAATEAFARAAAIDPLSARAQDELGFAAARIGEFGRAVEAWNNYLRLSSDEDDRREAVRKALTAVESLNDFLAHEPNETHERSSTR